MMNDTNNWLVHDHRKYDEMLTECEIAAEMADWKDAVNLFNKFTDELKSHMQLEDEIIYPLFEKKSADAEDAITELHEQHDDLVRLLTDLVYVMKNKNIDHFMESLIPLHKIMNEHNKYEEEVFLHLGNDELLMHRDEVMQQLAALQAKEGYHEKEWSF